MNTRTKRQIAILKKWEKNNYKGTLLAATGFGKTTTSIMAILGLVNRKNIKSVIVVVPSVILKEQWEDKLFANELHHITNVYVINSAANKSAELKCDLVIYDEFHRAGSEFFGKVLDIPYKYALALTATVERSDGAHVEMLKQLPVIDEVTIEEALLNGWVSNYAILNLMVPFTEDDLYKYTQAERSFRHYASECNTASDGMNSMRAAQSFLKSNDPTLTLLGMNFFRTLRLKNKLCKENPQKLLAASYLIKTAFSDKQGFIFSTSIDFAKQLQKLINDHSVMFHSKMNKKAKSKAMDEFLLGNKRMINAVASLNEGADVPSCELGVIVNGSSSKRDARQQLGRIIRATKDSSKKAILINLCTPGTTEETWATSKFEGLPYSNIWKTDLDKLL